MFNNIYHICIRFIVVLVTIQLKKLVLSKKFEMTCKNVHTFFIWWLLNEEWIIVDWNFFVGKTLLLIFVKSCFNKKKQRFYSFSKIFCVKIIYKHYLCFLYLIFCDIMLNAYCFYHSCNIVNNLLYAALLLVYSLFIMPTTYNTAIKSLKPVF